MAKPWRAASELLRGYFKARNEVWPPFEASALLQSIQLSGNRWVNSQHRKEAAIILARARFDVDDLVENYLGWNFYIQSLEYLDKLAQAPVYGFARPQRREITICERTLQYKPLYRTSVMHEVGHVLLHGSSTRDPQTYSPNSPHRPPKEREADQFMHTALLPRSILLLAVAYVADSWGISVWEALGCANTKRGRWQWKKRFFTTIINKLCVSRELIAIKMKSLRVFSQQTLDYHRAYPLPNQWRHSQPLWGIMHRLLNEIERTCRMSESA